MIKPKCLIIISRYKEDWQWVRDYTDYFLIYNKGEPISDPNVINVPNHGGNQIDIFRYIIDHYENLPELMAFVQATPWDHCKKEIFDKLIYNEFFTPLEYYGLIPANDWERRDEFGGFLEINNSWYLSCAGDRNFPCSFSSFDQFMDSIFLDYDHVDFIRFSPGSMYLIEKNQALNYSKDFWKRLMKRLNRFNPTEAHLIERSLWIILQCKLKER